MRVIGRGVLMLSEATDLDHLLILLLVALHHGGQTRGLCGSATSERKWLQLRALGGALARQTPSRPG